MLDFQITRCEGLPYLFNLTLSNGTVHCEIAFDAVQQILGVKPEDHARIDDGRFMLLI